MVTATSSRRLLDGFDSVVGVGASRVRAHPPSPKRIGFLDAQDSRPGATISHISDIAMSSTRTPSFMSPLTHSGIAGDINSTLENGSDNALKYRHYDETEISALRRSLEDHRAEVRELQRQHRQDSHLRSERDDALESLKSKLSGFATRDQLETQVQELRAASERRYTDISRDFQKRFESMEASLESLQSSAAVGASASNAELGSFIGKTDTSQSFAFANHSHLDSKMDIRLTSLEQKTIKLSAQLAGFESSGSRHESEATIAAEGASRRADNAERRVDAVEASHDNLLKKLNKLSLELHVLSDTTANERERASQLQHNLEEMRERSTSNQNTSAASIVVLETTIEQQRSKLEEEVRVRQKSLRELEQQMNSIASNIDRVTSGTKSSATAEAMIDAEARVESLKKKSAEQMQQILTRVQKSEEALMSVETVTSGNVTAVLDRLAKLEVLVSEDVSKFERLEQRFEERTAEMKTSIDVAVEHRSTEAVTNLVTKLGTERFEVERRWDQLQSEVRSLSVSLDSVKDSQRRASQANTADAGRLAETRQEVKRCTEETAAKLRMWVEDLDARLREVEPVIRESSDVGHRMRHLEKQLDKFEPRMCSAEGSLKDMKDMEFRLRELEPRLKQLQMQMEPTLGSKDKELEPRLRDLEQMHIRNMEKNESRWRELEPQVKQTEFRFKELEIRLLDLKDFEPRLKGFEPSLTRLETQVRDVDGRLKDMEPRHRELEPRMKEITKELELRIKDLEKEHVRDLEPRVRDCERELLPRVKDIEPRLARLHDIEPRLASIELRLRDIEPHFKDFRDVEPRFMRSHDIEVRLKEIAKDVKDLEPRVKELEPRIRELEPRVKELHLWLVGFEPRLKILEPNVNSLEQLTKGIEPRLQQLEQHRTEMDRVASVASDASDAASNLQRLFEARMCECFSSIRDESAAWRDALRAESAGWREACGDLRCRTESTREEVQHLVVDAREIANRCREIANRNATEWKAEVNAEKVKLDQLADGLNDARHRIKDQVDEASAKLEAKFESRISQSLNEVGWRLSRRIDEGDACMLEVRAAIDDHHRQTLALEQAVEIVRKRVDKEKEEFNHILQSNRQGITSQAVSQALDATKEKLEEASRATERCEESCRQASRATAEVEDLGKDLVRKFERWSDQTQEVAQTRSQERLQEMVRLALGDLSTQLSTMSEKHCDKVLKKSQKEILAETKEDLLKFAAETASKCEQSLSALSNRFDSEISRLDGQSNQSQSQILQESNLREAVEQGLTSLWRGLDHQRAHLTEVCDRVLPGIQSALAEEKQSRSDEAQRFQERLREIEGQNNEQEAAQRRAEAGMRDYETKFVESLRGAEAAVLAVDKRLFCLEEATEERLHEIVQEVNHDVMKRVVAHVEGNHRGDMQVLEGKMDRIARSLHTPSTADTGLRSKNTNSSLEDREAFRRRFRASLGDSLYVKKTLTNGGRSASDICLHNERRRAGK